MGGGEHSRYNVLDLSAAWTRLSSMIPDRTDLEVFPSPPTRLAPKARSAVSNQKELLPGLDGRSASARRFRDLVLGFVSDAGGIENISEVRLGLIRRLAAVTVQIEL